jgi:hypothetical protein
MTGGTVIFIIILLVFMFPMVILGLSLLTPSTRQMIPPSVSFGGLFIMGGILFGSGYFLL